MVFLLSYLMKGDPVSWMLETALMTPQESELLRSKFGLDLPIHTRYFNYMTQLLHGDMGRSIISRQKVRDAILLAYPWTLKLVVTAMSLSLILGVTFGIIAAVKRGTLFDYMARGFSLLGIGVPNFWLGIVMIIIFAVWLNILPATSTGQLQDIILPAFAVALPETGLLSRLTRQALIEEMSKDYVRTAKAKGVPHHLIISHHALKNSLISVLTVWGLRFGHMLGGSVIIETVFSWPGIGLLLYNAIMQRDLPLIQGIILIVTIGVIIINIIIDLVYAYLDPRIKY